MKLLSICIPTYNRAEFLRQTIESIIQQERFQKTHDVEIIISDNNSNDETEALGSKYQSEYPEKIYYYKNEQNLEDSNFIMALSRGNGLYLKLNNDTLVHARDSLNNIIDIVINQSKLGNVFFTWGMLKENKIIKLNNFDSFIYAAHYWITWIAGFGISKDTFNKYYSFKDVQKSNLMQTEALLRVLQNQKEFYIYDKPDCFVNHNVKKEGYSFVDVFLVDFLKKIKKCYDENKISKNTVEYIYKKTINELSVFWYIQNLKGQSDLKFNGFRRVVYRLFKYNVLKIISFEIRIIKAYVS